MKRIIIFILLFLSFWLNKLFADNVIATWLTSNLFHFVKWNWEIENQKFYTLNNITWNNNILVWLTNSGYTRIPSSWTYWTKLSWHDTILNTTPSWRVKYDYYNWNETIYFLGSWTANTNAVFLRINNITGEYYTYFITNTMFWYWTDAFRTNLKVISLGDELIFYNTWLKYFRLDLNPWDPTVTPDITISEINEPWFINPAPISITWQYVRWEWWNVLRTCSNSNSVYNFFAWNTTGSVSNHSSINIETAFWKSYTNNWTCILYYLPNSNLTLFTQFNNNNSFSSYYIPWIWFRTTSLEYGYYIYSHDIYNNTYAYVNIANNPTSFRWIPPTYWIAPFSDINQTWSLNYPYLIYQNASEITTFYSTANIVNNNLTTPTLSGTTITWNQNNSIVNNNTNNINLNPIIENTLNIPWVCPFGKKLSPIKWTDLKYYCQVNEWFICPYWVTTPLFFLDWYFCEIPEQENWNSWTWQTIPDYTNLLNNSGANNNSNFGTGTIQNIIWGGLSIWWGWISWLFNNTITWTTNKTNSCENIISWWIFQYSIWLNNNFFSIDIENFNSQKMIWEANWWKLEFFWVDFLKPIYSILDFFWGFVIKLYNYIVSPISDIIDLFWYLFNNVQRNKWYCYLWQEFYIYNQSNNYKSYIDWSIKTNNLLYDIIVICAIIITNIILILKLKKW